MSATTGQGMADWLAWIEAAFNAIVEQRETVVMNA